MDRESKLSQVKVLIPVFSAVGLHQISVGVEENPPAVIDQSHPDWEYRSLVSGAQVDGSPLGLIRVPIQESKLIPPRDSNFSLPKLKPRKLSSPNQPKCRLTLKSEPGGGGMTPL